MTTNADRLQSILTSLASLQRHPKLNEFPIGDDLRKVDELLIDIIAILEDEEGVNFDE